MRSLPIVAAFAVLVFAVSAAEAELPEAEASYYSKDGLKKLKLTSKLGFSLENIPLEGENSRHFFDECVALFLKAEKYLPLAKEAMVSRGYNAREISTLKFRFPEEPIIGSKSGRTLFEHKKLGWAFGATDRIGGDTAVVTGSVLDNSDFAPLHEYIHMSGYDAGYHDHEVFDCAKIKNLEKSPE